MRPNECKWCGCSDTIASHSDSMSFACRTYWGDCNGGVWVQDEACADRMVAQAEILRERIRHALERLKSAERYDTDEADPDTWCGDDVAQVVNAEHVDEVIRILKGASDERTK